MRKSKRWSLAQPPHGIRCPARLLPVARGAPFVTRSIRSHSPRKRPGIPVERRDRLISSFSDEKVGGGSVLILALSSAPAICSCPAAGRLSSEIAAVDNAALVSSPSSVQHITPKRAFRPSRCSVLRHSGDKRLASGRVRICITGEEVLISRQLRFVSNPSSRFVPACFTWMRHTAFPPCELVIHVKHQPWQLIERHGQTAWQILEAAGVLAKPQNLDGQHRQRTLLAIRAEGRTFTTAWRELSRRPRLMVCVPAG